MPITFQDVLVYNHDPTLSIEDVYRHRGEFAGIHQFEFESLVDDTFSSLSGWTDTRSVWQLFSGTATGVATATGTSWNYGELWHNLETPSSFKLEAYLNGGAGDGNGIIFRGNGSDNYYVLVVNADSCGFYVVENGTSTVLSVIDQGPALYAPALVELAVIQEQYSKETEDRYLFMTFRLDGRTILSAKHHIPDTVPGLRWGLAVTNGDIARWDRVRIPDLPDIVTWTSLDPGESAISSIKRAIGDRVIAHMVRRQALRVWRPKAQVVDYIIPADNQLSVKYERDSREIITHLRLQYASGWVDAFDANLLSAYGHRFKEVYNADIYHEAEAYTEALAVIRRAKEEAYRCSFTVTNLGYLLEPEDRIQLPDSTTWLIDSVTLQVRHHARVTIHARRYVF